MEEIRSGSLYVTGRSLADRWKRPLLSRELSDPEVKNLSRNFELLRRAETEQEWLGTSLAPPPAPALAARPQFRKSTLEEEAKLVQRLFLSGPEAPRTVVFCGAEFGYAPSWICARAGEVLAAQVTGPVCTVDANFRVPHVHQCLEVESPLGLTDAMLDVGPVQNFIQQTRSSNLWLLPCGSQVSELGTLLRPDRLKARMADLRAQFDYVLISAQPVHLAVDAVVLSQTSDGVVLVLEANSSRREVAQQVKLTLEAAGVKLLGAVLNNRTFPIPDVVYRKL